MPGFEPGESADPEGGWRQFPAKRNTRTPRGLVPCCAAGSTFEPFEAEEPPTTTMNWQFVGEGKGGYTKSSAYNFVGEGSGSYIQEEVVQHYGWKIKPCCCGLIICAAVSLALLPLAGYMASEMSSSGDTPLPNAGGRPNPQQILPASLPPASTASASKGSLPLSPISWPTNASLSSSHHQTVAEAVEASTRASPVLRKPEHLAADAQTHEAKPTLDAARLPQSTTPLPESKDQQHDRVSMPVKQRLSVASVAPLPAHRPEPQAPPSTAATQVPHAPIAPLLAHSAEPQLPMAPPLPALGEKQQAPATEVKPAKAGINCDEGWENWRAKWSVLKKTQCCQETGKGCPVDE